mmetsp:Transcript_84300/g.247268  ORF Transcript_84300/g.247268 Transcript_84300/m.247268 type:complete len:274 (-) Transcript_84300:925-1746(-)
MWSSRSLRTSSSTRRTSTSSAWASASPRRPCPRCAAGRRSRGSWRAGPATTSTACTWARRTGRRTPPWRRPRRSCCSRSPRWSHHWTPTSHLSSWARRSTTPLQAAARTSSSGRLFVQTVLAVASSRSSPSTTSSLTRPSTSRGCSSRACSGSGAPTGWCSAGRSTSAGTCRRPSRRKASTGSRSSPCPRSAATPRRRSRFSSWRAPRICHWTRTRPRFAVQMQTDAALHSTLGRATSRQSLSRTTRCLRQRRQSGTSPTQTRSTTGTRSWKR